MHIEFYVEELSMQQALENIVPKIVGEEVSFNIYVHNGKKDLLQNLPNRLKRYTHLAAEDYRIVVLVDRDSQDCVELKKELEAAAQQANLITKSAAEPEKPFQVMNRIIVEELEAWFFGDMTVVIAAYPGISPKLANKASYRNPDTILGGTWEALERELSRAGYVFGKIQAAREISKYMNPLQNRSKSFQVFRDGLLELIKTQ